MVDSYQQLTELIGDGKLQEHLTGNVELKRSWTSEYGHKLSALANCISNDVSWLVVGIEDNGKLSGHNEKWAKQTEETISQILGAKLDPTQACQGIKCENLDSNWIIIVKMQNPGSVVKWDNSAYKKIGTTIAKMEPDEEMELTIRLPGLSDYSKQAWTGTLETQKVESFANLIFSQNESIHTLLNPIETNNALLEYLKIEKTNTARLLFGDCRYRIVLNDAEGNPIKNEVRSGLLDLLSNTTREEIQQHTKQLNSVSIYPFPEKALKEGIGNAVAHAAYFENDGEIILEVYANRIEISNLCLPDSTYFANKWFSRSHKTFNKLLMEVLRIARYVDELGRGKFIIFSDSIRNGMKAPIVTIEKSGRYNRWRLIIFGGHADPVQIRLRERLKEKYPQEQKAMIAHALIQWKDKSVTEIKHFIDGESAPYFAEVLGDLDGPLFYYEKNDEIVLNRWVKILIDEGQDSKSFSGAEEEWLYNFCYDMCTKYHNSEITPKQFRNFAHMGNTNSDKTLSSKILKKWKSQGKTYKLRSGLYKFNIKAEQQINFAHLLEILKEKRL